MTVLLTGAVLLKGQVKNQGIPDAPAPQQHATTVSSVFSGVTPGQGTTSSSNDDNPDAATPSAPALPTPPSTVDSPVDQTPPETPATGEGAATVNKIYHVRTTFVEVPVTVKDSKGNLVPGLTWRDFHILENGQPQRMALFTVDPFPISAAIVIDQSLPADTMKKVNESLAALQGAFTPQDELAIYTYNNGPQLRTQFTGAQSERVSVVLKTMQTKGRDMGVPVNSGPMAGGISINGKPDFDNNPTMHPHNNGTFITVPKEVHTLNDAILAAATEVSGRGAGRRRIVYVISDGKEQGSKAGFKEVKQYLLTNKVSVYATLVGDSATWGLGFLDHTHIPFMMRDNILPQYAAATGGQVDAEFRQNSIETSFARIAEEVRLQYTIGYNSHVSTLDSRYRTIEILIGKPGLTVIARPGYYPTAAPLHP
jgi:VWFA-related protein